MPARYNFLAHQTYGFDDEIQNQIPLEHRDLYARAILTIAAADGLSTKEAEYFANLSAAMEMPEEMIAHYLAYDTSSATLTELLTPLRNSIPGTSPAPFLLYDAIKVASVDGYTDKERTKVAESAKILGVSGEHVAALEGLVAAENGVRTARLAAFAAASAAEAAG